MERAWEGMKASEEEGVCQSSTADENRDSTAVLNAMKELTKSRCDEVRQARWR